MQDSRLKDIPSVLLDVLESSPDEAALSDSDTRGWQLTDELPILVCRFLPDGTLTYINDWYCRYFDRPLEALIGQSVFQFIPLSQREALRARYQQLTPDSATTIYEYEVLTRDGQLHRQRWTDRALFDVQGRLLGYQSVGQDVTQQPAAAPLNPTRRQPSLAGEPTSLNLADYLLRLTGHLAQLAAASGVSLQTAFDAVEVDMDTAIRCGLIINQLAAHTLEHAFPKGRGGQLTVELQADAANYRLVVQASDLEWPASLTVLAADPLGLQWVVNLTHQLPGSLTVRQLHGLRFEIHFGRAWRLGD